MKKLLFLLCMIPFSLQSHEIMINTHDGETFVFDVEPDESLEDLEEKVTALIDGEPRGYLIEVSPEDGERLVWDMDLSRNQGSYLGFPRNYCVEVTSAEKADIRFIVMTLANKSLVAIGLAKQELESAGDRIDHLHPLRFLQTLFADEELKVGVRNVRGKGWVWKHFVSGLKGSLATEANHGNICDEFIIDFANNLEVDVDLIYPLIQNRQWDDFIDVLITHIPRKGDHDRYDC